MDLQKESNDLDLEIFLFKLLKEVSKGWKKGFFEKVKRETPPLYDSIKEKEELINKLWHNYRDGVSSLEELKKAIENWVNSLKENLKGR